VVRFSDLCCIKSTSLNPDANSSPVPQESAAAELRKSGRRNVLKCRPARRIRQVFGPVAETSGWRSNRSPAARVTRRRVSGLHMVFKSRIGFPASKALGFLNVESEAAKTYFAEKRMVLTPAMGKLLIRALAASCRHWSRQIHLACHVGQPLWRLAMVAPGLEDGTRRKFIAVRRRRGLSWCSRPVW
jgi:hypothetical protein